MAATNLPPKCSRFVDADSSLYDRYLFFIQDVDSSGTGDRDIAWHQSAKTLATDLHSKAVDLGMSRAHEYSDDIYWLDQCAAVVSLIAFGRQSSDFEKYEAAVHYYRNFPSTAPRVMEFDRYVQSA